MPGLFSEHVARMAAGAEVGLEILEEIKKVLRSELRRRGIFEYGPTLLGYLGNRWDDPEPMDDLAQDCYVRAILTRLRGLKENLKRCGDIEGLVRRNIRSFVGEKQAALDPVGYAVFQNVKAALERLCEAEVLNRVPSEDGKRVTASSQYQFAGQSGSKDLGETELKEGLRQSGQFFDGIETLCRVGAAAQDKISEAVKTLRQSGVRFSVGALKRSLCDLLAEVSSGNSLRGVIFSEFSSELIENIRTRRREPGYEETEHIQNLTETLKSKIDGLSRSQKIKSRLHQLLDHLVNFAQEHEGEKTESLNELAEQFGISRSTVHEDFQCLRSLLREQVDAIKNKSNGDRHG